MTETKTVPSQQGKEGESSRQSSGTYERLKNGGFRRIIYGKDLYLSILLSLGFLVVYVYGSVAVVNVELIANGSNLAISLTAFILAGLAILVSFSDEKFLGLLKELQIYDTLIFNFEFSVLLALTTAVLGIMLQSYAGILQSSLVWEELFFLYVFFFIYMVLATANLVSVIVSIGSRKAKIAMIELNDANG